MWPGSVLKHPDSLRVQGNMRGVRQRSGLLLSADQSLGLTHGNGGVCCHKTGYRTWATVLRFTVSMWDTWNV